MEGFENHVKELIQESKTEQKKLLKDYLEKLETEEEFKINVSMTLSPNEAIEVLNGQGFHEVGDFDSNGWQWDWWESFYNKDRDIFINLNGSGWHGGVSIRIPDGYELDLLRENL